MRILHPFKARHYWKPLKLTALTLCWLVPTGCWSGQVKNAVSFSGTQRKSLLSCLLLAVEWWFDSALCRTSCCPFTPCNGNISSSYISSVQKETEGEVQRFCQRRSLLLSRSQPPPVCPTRGWGKHCVPHAGPGEAVGAALPAGIPAVGTQRSSMLGVETSLILLWKILSSPEQLAGLKGRFRLPYSTSLIRLSI